MKQKKGNKTKTNSKAGLPPPPKGIVKAKPVKVKKIEAKPEVVKQIKEEVKNASIVSRTESERQLRWNSYLKIFADTESLEGIQGKIMEFCTNKKQTPPKRKGKFLNFVRNCFPQQSEVTDEICNELFDLIIEKYILYKEGGYGSDAKTNNVTVESNSNQVPKLGKNKRKKLKNSQDVELAVAAPSNVKKKPKKKKKKGVKAEPMDTES